jgi:nitrate reductase NapE component
MMEGPQMLRDLWPSSKVKVSGEVTRVAPLDQHELHRQVYQYEFRYELDGHEHTGKSNRAGRKHEVGDTVDIVVDPARPDSARIDGTRRREVPMWVAGMFGSVLPLLGIGLVGNYLFNLRWLRLIRGAEATQAWPRKGSPKDLDPTDSQSARNALSRHQFELGDQMYFVDPRSWAHAEDGPIAVLYDPMRPGLNLGLDTRHAAMLSGRQYAWGVCLGEMLVPVACVGGLIWLWNGM